MFNQFACLPGWCLVVLLKAASANDGLDVADRLRSIHINYVELKQITVDMLGERNICAGAMKGEMLHIQMSEFLYKAFLLHGCCTRQKQYPAQV